MNPMHQCIQKILPGNPFSYVRDIITDKGDAICPPPPITNGEGIKNKTKVFMTAGSLMKVESFAECSLWNILQYF